MYGSKGTILVIAVVAVLFVGTECARLGGSGMDTDLASNIRGRVYSNKFFGANSYGAGCIDPDSNKMYPLHSVIQRNNKLCRCVKLNGMMNFSC